MLRGWVTTTMSSEPTRSGSDSPRLGSGYPAVPVLGYGLPVKIFVSWSGPAEQLVAEALKTALPNICAADVEVFVSSKSIAKGVIGTAVIEAKLSGSDYGLVLVSQANQGAPWLMYEGGWLASTLERPVATICLDLRPSDLTTPLSPRQATVFVEEDMRELLRQIVEVANPSMSDRTFDVLFASAWPDIDKSWSPGSNAASAAPHRTDSDMLAELVERVRRIEERDLSRKAEKPRIVDTGATSRFERLVKEIAAERSGGSVTVLSASLRGRNARVMFLVSHAADVDLVRRIENGLLAVLPSDVQLSIDVITGDAGRVDAGDELSDDIRDHH